MQALDVLIAVSLPFQSASADSLVCLRQGDNKPMYPALARCVLGYHRSSSVVGMFPDNRERINSELCSLAFSVFPRCSSLSSAGRIGF